MRSFRYVFIVCLLMAATGCQKDIPEPETKIMIQPTVYSNESHEVPVFGAESDRNDPFFVRHEVKGKNVLIECIVEGITFRETQASNKGKIILYINGKKEEEISSAAFIVKGLKAGTHRLKLEVVMANDPSPVMKKELDVTIR